MNHSVRDLSLKAKLLVILAGLGMIAAAVFSVYMYKSSTDKVYADAHESANLLITRAVEMFMVSTRKFHQDFKIRPMIHLKGDGSWMTGIERYSQWTRPSFMTMV